MGRAEAGAACSSDSYGFRPHKSALQAVFVRRYATASSASDEQLAAIRAVLKGQRLCPVDDLFDIVDSRPHGHVDAVNVAMSRLELPALLGSRPSRERSIVLAMLVARILAPHTKLATTRWWHTTTLADDFGVADANEDDLYAAMDWLLERQPAIEKKLATRHLGPGALVLYDLSSSYFEGSTCPLARLGYSRDGKKASCRSTTGCSAMRAAVRWRSRCTRATPPIQRR